MRELQVIEMRLLLLKCVDCVRILGKLVIIRFFTSVINGVDDAVDLVIGLPTMIYDSIGNLLVAAKANDIEANPLNEFLQEVADFKFLWVFWFREVNKQRMREFLSHVEHGREVWVSVMDYKQQMSQTGLIYNPSEPGYILFSSSSGSRLEYLDACIPIALC